jgi:hypothetical protein
MTSHLAVFKLPKNNGDKKYAEVYFDIFNYLAKYPSYYK